MFAFNSTPSTTDQVRVTIAYFGIKGGKRILNNTSKLLHYCVMPNEDHSVLLSSLNAMITADYHATAEKLKKFVHQDSLLTIEYSPKNRHWTDNPSKLGSWLKKGNDMVTSFFVKVYPSNVSKQQYEESEKEVVHQALLKVSAQDLKEANPGLIAADAVWERWAELCSLNKSVSTKIPEQLESLFSTTANKLLVEDTLEEHDLLVQFLSGEMVRMTKERNDFENTQRLDLFRRMANFMLSSRKRPSSVACFGRAAKKVFREVEERLDNTHMLLEQFP
ncbi:hypothetical protein GEMRC1_012205 [Eukaryota sp. GEM-RC1]